MLDAGCNAGLWAIQARLAGAREVVGIDASPRNIEQAKLILRITGLNGIDYRVLNVHEVASGNLGEFDVSLLIGLLYHLDDPVGALKAMGRVTRRILLVDTFVLRRGGSMAELRNDRVHDQNFSNGLSWLPSRAAVALMLRAAGFREVYEIPTLPTAPPDYLSGQETAFVAVKGT